MTGGEGICLSQLVGVSTLESIKKRMVWLFTEKSIFLLQSFLLLLNSNKSRIYGVAKQPQHSAGEVVKKTMRITLEGSHRPIDGVSPLSCVLEVQIIPQIPIYNDEQ